MRAAVYKRYGPPEVLQLEEVMQPVPKANEVLVKIHASTVNRTDCAIRSGKGVITRIGYSIVTTGKPFKALLHPKQQILGTELAGEVVAIGASVTSFAVGDQVFGVNAGDFGTHAEFICLSEKAPLAHKPVNVTYAEAAGIPDGAILALGCLRRANLRAGQRILVYGASGSIGTAAVQLAKYFDAYVTAVCRTKNVEIVRALGAHEVIDYTQVDYTKTGETYDVIFDAVGKHAFRRCKGSLKSGGIYLSTDGWENLFLSVWTQRFGDKRVMLDIPPHYRQQDIVLLKELIEAGRYRAVIDRCYPLEQVVEANRYVETEQKTGNVVLTISSDCKS